jgi:uncharacterized protein YukE
MSKSPSPLPPNSYNLIGGDIEGFSDLARILYDYDSNTQEVGRNLSGTVNRLAGSWQGQAASSFRASYGLDASDVGWLGRVATSIGDTVDELAVRLAKIESQLESNLAQGVNAGYISVDSSGRMTVIPGQQGRAAKFVRQMARSVANGRRAATAARKAAASQLETQYKMLSAGLEKYSNPMTQDPGGLLTEDQEKALRGKTTSLNEAAGKAEGSLHGSAAKLHVDAAFKDAGIGAATVGSVVGIAALVTGPIDPVLAGGAAGLGYVGGFLVGLVSGK